MHSGSSLRARLLASAFSVGLLSAALGAQAAEREFNIAPQSLDTALADFSRQSMVPVLATPNITGSKRTTGVTGAVDAPTALAMLLQGTGLTYRREGDTFLIVKADQDPQGGSAAAGGAEVEALIVTAQKREEDIQDVPIAISAFTQEDLTRSQIAGGPDLITQVPNMTFTKTNFSSYSIQLRGIGTQAISATTDPAVAVAFNNTPFIRNRFFEQEFYDLQRVEVLRGPQGTLYGRNATAGVVNIISQKPQFNFEAKASADISNYNSSRIEGMINVPLVEDKVALRLAGAWTKRDGYVTNEITGNPIDGRDLWSTRLSLRLAPTDAVDVNLIWEHFEEDDDRLRSGKQTCKKHIQTQVGPYDIGYTEQFSQAQSIFLQSVFSQGCERNSLYAADSFQTPNGYALPFYHPLGALGLAINSSGLDPYVSAVQSRDLRVIESTVDPTYRAETDLAELQVSWDVTDNLTLSSETAWLTDFVFSSQDFNRFNTTPGAWANDIGTEADTFFREGVLTPGPNGGGIFCDPQIGCSDRLVSIDLSTAESSHFSQEFRLASNFGGPINFSVGANFLRYDTDERYYVFINALTLYAARVWGDRIDNSLTPWVAGVTDNRECLRSGPIAPDPTTISFVVGCTYIDPNPIENLNGEGHNYFLSRNPYKLLSYAAFGELYYEVTDNLKITAGLRYTIDRKEAPRIPSWVLAAASVGYPVAEVVEQEWREPTGRLTVDWKPNLGFTDETLLYASYAHGYKAGGANPPLPGLVVYDSRAGLVDAQLRRSITHPRTFDEEFIDAFELGAKNTFLAGRATANLAAFYYDYKGYQVSEIVDRSALNRNFDATVWGIEFETDWRPLENLRLGFKGGYEKTRLADGSRAVDLMDRTAGRTDWVVYRPFPTNPSNCIVPVFILTSNSGLKQPGNYGGGQSGPCEAAYLLGLDPVTNLPYVADPELGYDPINNSTGPLEGYDNYPGFNPQGDYGHNNGEGFYKNLSGNELPNAPQWTGTITADYTVPLPSEWLATLHTDLHWQAESWWRIFNDHEYNKIDEYFTMNLAAIFTNEERGWHVMAYIKNVLDVDAITGAFLNSDDTGLTTNVFLVEPRLYGLRATKRWEGGPLLGSFGARGQGPAPFTVELGGQVQRHEAPYRTLRPEFAGEFPEVLDKFAEAQNRELDWGDGRSVKLTFRPDANWNISAAYRTGEANGTKRRAFASLQSAPGCPLPSLFLCNIWRSGAAGPDAQKIANFSRTNWMEATAKEAEEHQVLDFAVGREFGFGRFPNSRLSLGLRHASLSSRMSASFDGIPDWVVPEGWAINPIHGHRYTADLTAQREYTGTGPTIVWDAGVPLFGNNDTGRLEVDWSVGGGILFGKQSLELNGDGEVWYYSHAGFPAAAYVTPPDTIDPLEPVLVDRSDSVTVPVLDLSLGFSYQVDRFSVSAGYRWERYFDVLDVGDEHGQQDADRTIDGPYFKIAVGFGG